MPTYTKNEVLAPTRELNRPLINSSTGSLNSASDTERVVRSAGVAFSIDVSRGNLPMLSYKKECCLTNMFSGVSKATEQLKPQLKSYKSVIISKIHEGLKDLLTSAIHPKPQYQDCNILLSCVKAADPSRHIRYSHFEQLIDAPTIDPSIFIGLVENLVVGLEKMKETPQMFSPSFFKSMKFIFDRQQILEFQGQRVSNTLRAFCGSLCNLTTKSSFDDICENDVSENLHSNLREELKDLSEFARKMLVFHASIDSAFSLYSAYQHVENVREIQELRHQLDAGAKGATYVITSDED